MIRHLIRSWSLLLTLLLAPPLLAQDEPAAEPAADDAVAIETVPADAAATGEPQLDTIPVAAEAEAEPEAEPDAEPWQLYAGLDLVSTTVGTDAGDADSGLYRLRIGRRVFEQIAVEFQYGVDNGGDGAGEVSTDSYYGLYLVPMALAFESVELSFPIGYAKTDAGGNGLSSMAYGVNADLPLRGFGEDLPDLRFGLGWMVYHQGNSARVYGVNVGLRYDFTTASLGNPFGWVGDLDLWPFGDDAEAAE